MKLKRRAQEVPPKIRAFINSVTTAPLENIEEPLKHFVWEFDKGDFHHWVDLFNHFDAFFEKYIKSRKDLQLEDDLLDSDPPFPKASVLQILRVIRIILENCTNKQFHSSYEQHLSALLASTDVDVVEACLQTLAAFLKKTVGKFSIRDASLKSKLYALAQGWGVKEEGLGLVACALESGCDPDAYDLGSSLHYEYYAVSESGNGHQAEECPEGLRIIHLSNIGSHPESDLQHLHNLISEHKVPSSLRFSLLTRLRFAKAFGSLASRQQYTCIRLYAFIVLVKASIDADDLVSFFNAEPEFINELLSLLSYEEAVPEKIRVLCLLSLVALCQDRSRQPSVLSAVTSGGHRGILSSLVQKAIDSVISGSTKWSVVFAEALLSLVTALVSSSTGCSAMREAGFIATLLPLLKDTDPQHLHLVSTAVHILEAFMDYSNPAAALFRELGGLDDTIARLKVEVSYVENGSKQQVEASDCSGSTSLISDAASDLDNVQSLYSDALVSYHRRMLMKALLHAISLGTYAPGNSSSVYGSDGSLLPHCLRIIFQRAKDFGGGVFSLAATVMSDLIHKDPTCFSVLEAAGLPSAFLDAIMDVVVCSSEAVSCIPQCLDALCLNNNGLQAVKDRNALRCFVKFFTSRSYMRALTGDTPGSLSSGLDELLRHASSLREPGVEMLIEILNTISNIGSGIEPSNLATVSMCLSTTVPMETDTEGGSSGSPREEDAPNSVSSEQNLDPLPDASASNVEAFLPVCVSNAACLLETVLQNAETCRMFVEKKGIEAVLQLLTLPLMPVSVSLGHNMRVAFKNFSLQHYGSLARAVCTFLREYSKSTCDLLVSIGGVPLARVDPAVQAKVLRNLSVLEGILFLSAFQLKGATALFSELGSGDAEVLKELGRAYREVIWQKSLCDDSKVEEERTVEQGGPENADAGSSNPVGRESDDDANAPAVGYMNPVSARSGSQSMWSGEREFFSVRSGESLHRRSRHGFSRIRGGRTGRHLEVFNLEIEAQTNAPETSSHSAKKKTPDVIAFDILGKLESSLRSFFTAIVKGFTSSNRRRGDSGTMGSASMALGSALAKIFLEGLTFSGHLSSEGLAMPLSVKCRYLGKVVDDMAAVTFDSRRHTCYATMINNFYVHGTFKELLTTFEATSQLLWTPPYSTPTVVTDHVKVVEETKLSHSTWLRDTLQSYRRGLEYFVNAGFLLSPTSTTSQALLLVQPVTTGLSIGLFPVPRDPDMFVQMLQSQVLDVILPVWNHQTFPSCSPDFVASIVSLVTHIYSGVGDVKRSRNGGITGSSNQHYMPPPLDEASIGTIVEMGFTRVRAEEALRRVETISVEMAMEWLFSHPEDPVQEDDELARALALSLGSSSEAPKTEAIDKLMDVAEDVNQKKAPPVDDILSALVKLFQNSDVLSFPLTDLLVTLCNRNKGEDRPKVIVFLIQQLKKCRLDFSSESGALGMISHVIALVLSEDGSTREIASQNGIVSIAVDILMNFKASNELVDEVMVPKCISALLLILDNMLQPRPKDLSENSEGTVIGSLPDPSPEQASLSVPLSVPDKDAVSEVRANESGSALEKIFGNSTGYLTIEESHKLLQVACDFIKQQVPSLVMQAVLQLCARLTKTHALALEFLERGALTALFSLPRACFFPGYDTVASAIIRHLIEDPQTLQTAMEMEIRQTLSGNRHAARIPPRAFLTSMAPVISRDPAVFMKAATSICQLESSGGRTSVVLLKEKDKSKASGSEAGLVLNDSGKLPENKMHDGSVKCSKGHRKVPANLAQVIDHLLDIVVNFPSSNSQDGCASDLILMDVDEPAVKVKGKSKVDVTRKIDSESERSAGLAKVTFILKLLSDILLMYVHAVGVILKRDLELCQLQLSNQYDESANYGILHHILHNLVALSADKFAGPDEWREKLSEKASLFLVVLCGRSSEGRRRVVTELVKTFSSFANSESNSSRTTLLPTKQIFSFAELTYSILSKNSSSSNLPSSGCSADVAKSMIDGGMVQCLADVLQMIDLDHPDAPKTVNLIVKSLESLTRAANMSEQVVKSDAAADKNETGGLNDGVIGQVTEGPTEMAEDSRNRFNQQEASNAVEAEEQQHQGSPQTEGNAQDENPDLSASQDVRSRIEETMASSPAADLGIDYIQEEMEESDPPRSTNHIEVTIRVDNRGGDDMGDDDMADDADEDEDDDDGEDEDEAEDGTGMMSLADTDVEDHDDTGLGDDFNDEMIDEEDDDFHENSAIEVRWREALDGLDHHLQVLGQPGAATGLIDVAAEPFEGVNVDDLYGIRRSLGFERRRQTVRSSFDRSSVEASGFQHPLLLRPNQSLTSSGTLSRDLESLSSEGNDGSHIYMFDAPAPVLTYDHAPNSLFSSRLTSSLPPPLAGYSLGLDSLQLPGRRGLGDGRWTDDGQPQAGSQAAAIAQAVEEQFLSHLRLNTPAEQQLENPGVQEKQQLDAPNSESRQFVEGDNSGGQQEEGQHQENDNGEGNQQSNPSNDQVNHAIESSPFQEPVNPESAAEVSMSVRPLSPNSTPNHYDNMEIGNGNGSAPGEAETFLEFVISSMEAGGQGGSSVFADVTAHTDQATDDLDIPGDAQAASGHFSADVEMNSIDLEENEIEQSGAVAETDEADLSSRPETLVAQHADQPDQTVHDVAGGNAIDPTFLEALPEDLRAEVLASQQAQSVQPPAYVPPSAEEIDPEFLAALPPEIQAEVLAQQRAQRATQQAAQPVDMDNASIIATFPAELREEVLLTSSEAVLSALPSPLLAEAQMLRDRAMSHYQARSLFGTSHRLNNRRSGLGFDRQSAMDRGVGVTIGQRAASTVSDGLKVREFEGQPLLDAKALKALIRLLRLAQPLGKGLLQRLLLNLCAHSTTRANLVLLLLNMMKPETEGSASGLPTINSQRLYGCQSNTIFGRSQLLDGLPPLVLRRILEILTYLATNHSAVANMLFYIDPSILSESSNIRYLDSKSYKGKEKVVEGVLADLSRDSVDNVPLVLFLQLLDRPLFSQSTTHFEQVLGLIQVIVYCAAAQLESQPQVEQEMDDTQMLPEQSADVKEAEPSSDPNNNDNNKLQDKSSTAGTSSSAGKMSVNTYDVFLQLPQSDLCNLCSLLGREGLSDKVYLLASEVLKKLARVAVPLRKLFILALSELAHDLSGSAVNELVILRNTHMRGLSAGSMAGAAMLRVLQALSSLTSSNANASSGTNADKEQEQARMWKLNTALESLWQELSNCIGMTEAQLGQSSLSPMSDMNVTDHVMEVAASSSLPPGTQRLLPYIEAFFVLSEKLQASHSIAQQDHPNITAGEVQEHAGSSSSSSATKSASDSLKKSDGSVSFMRFAEKHRRLLNAFVRQNPGLLENSLSMLLKTPRLVDFDNKRAYFRSRIRQQHEHGLSGPLRISVRRAYVLEDSYNQLRMRSTQELKGRLNVQFQGEEGIDAGGLTREWYQLLSRVIFDRGALLFTTVGNNATFQPNPNSVYQTEHLSYFKFVGRVVAKALFDGQLLDVHFTRSFYKHILGIKVTYHDIEAVDPDYYKNLKWMLENDVSDILDLTFSMDADEEKHILYEKNEVTDYELKHGGRNIRVTEETKHEYVDLVADHILTNAIRTQINSFLEGFSELIPRDLISIFHDKELELLISGLPEIDLDDLKANTEYSGYTAASSVVQWFWEVVKAFSKEDMARLLQFVTGTSKVPLEGFKALQGISGPQRFQIHKAYGAPDRLPSAHTCFNQLDLPEYTSKDQLRERLLLAIHEASEGFGFG